MGEQPQSHRAAPLPARFKWLMGVLLCLGTLTLLMDLRDGGTDRIISSAALLVGLLGLWQAKRFHSVRWRVLSWASFTLAFAAFIHRFALWRGWI